MNCAPILHHPAADLRAGQRGQAAPRGELVCREVLVLLAICMMDMLSSAYLFHHGMATEANPVLRPFVEMGVGPFLAAKSLAFLPQLAVAEWYRRRSPRMILPVLRWVAGFYLAIYGVLVLRQFIG